jgi:hypothetical protein
MSGTPIGLRSTTEGGRSRVGMARWALAAGGLAVVAGTAACGDLEEQSLCTVFADYVSAVASIDEVDLEQVSAGEAEDFVDDLIGTVRHLGDAADDRYSDQIEQLETALEDLLRVLEGVDEDADASTWQPLVEDSVEDAEQASARVIELIDPTCQPPPSDD